MRILIAVPLRNLRQTAGRFQLIKILFIEVKALLILNVFYTYSPSHSVSQQEDKVLHCMTCRNVEMFIKGVYVSAGVYIGMCVVYMYLSKSMTQTQERVSLN